MKIGFIGAGKVGCSLGKYFTEKGLKLSGFYSRSFEQAAFGAEQTRTKAFTELQAIVAASDWLFLTVSDQQILPVFRQLQPFLRPGMMVFHCSGAESSQLLAVEPERQYQLFSLHPMLAFPSRQTAGESIAQALFTLEGDREAESEVRKVLSILGNPIQTIRGEEKIRYHAACVMCSNLVNGLVYTSQELFQQAGFSPEAAETAWQNLFLENAKNIAADGAVAALTGPVERRDLATVEHHLANLTPQQAAIYQDLSQVLVKMAEGKHPAIDYTQIKERLKQ